MKRTPIAGAASALFLAATLALGGCGGDPASISSRPVTSDISSETSQSSAESSLLQTPPVTGTYNGQTITMRYVMETDLQIDIAYCRPFQNGFAIVMRSEDENLSYVDREGRVLGDASYAYASPFDKDGRALIQRADNSAWAYIDKTGKEVAEGKSPEISESDTSMFYEKDGIFGLLDENGHPLTEPVYSFVTSFDQNLSFVILRDGEHKNVLIDRSGNIQTILPDDCKYAFIGEKWITCRFGENDKDTLYGLYDKSGKPINARLFKAIGNTVDGLMPVMESGRVGLMDEQGNMIIEPSLTLDDNYQVDLCIGENIIVGSLNGRMVYIEVSRS